VANVETFVLHGLKRSGNHAFVNWFRSGRGRLYHINNAFPIAKEILHNGYFDFPQNLSRLLRKRFLKRVAKIGLGPADVLISIEDFPYSEAFFRTDRELRNLLIVRSPENVFPAESTRPLRWICRPIRVKCQRLWSEPLNSG